MPANGELPPEPMPLDCKFCPKPGIPLPIIPLGACWNTAEGT